MSHRYIFSSESVTEGHPDKVCDTISDYILDACLEQDPLSRVACETLAKGNLVVLAGEITSNAKFDFEERVRDAVRSIGYVNGDCIFHADTCRVICEMSEQSRDIKQGVDQAAAEGHRGVQSRPGVGDPGGRGDRVGFGPGPGHLAAERGHPGQQENRGHELRRVESPNGCKRWGSISLLEVLLATLTPGSGFDRQHVFGRRRAQGRAEPFCLWRHQGRRHRPDQVDRRRLRR